MGGKGYLVTGGAGFIGHHLVKRLLMDGHSVRVLDDFSTGLHENLPGSVECITGDIVDKGAVRQAMQGMAGCFHFAAISSVERARLYAQRSHDVNCTGTMHVMDAALQDNIPVVYASSAAVYGAAYLLPITEKSHPAPINQYGDDKWKGELYAYELKRSHALNSIGLRIFNCYGPGQRSDSIDSGVIAQFCNLALHRQSITVYGDGLQTRDFIYVDDVVALCVSAMQRLQITSQSLVVNACTGAQTSLLQLIELLSEILQYKVEIRFEPARTDAIIHSLGSAKLASAALGWEAHTALRDGLKQLLRQKQ